MRGRKSETGEIRKPGWFARDFFVGRCRSHHRRRHHLRHRRHPGRQTTQARPCRPLRTRQPWSGL